MDINQDKVAIIHDWLVTFRGGEKVLEVISELYPQAPIYTLFFNKNSIPATLKNKKIIYPNGFNKLQRFRKILLPVLPQTIESFNLDNFDLIISSSSCVAKGILANPKAKHISYVHSPMRYIWDQRHIYFKLLNKIPILNIFIQKMLKDLRIWDSLSSQRVDLFIANSNFVKSRIRKYYGRSSEVIPPPINLDRINALLSNSITVKDKNYYITVGAFVSYKRFDLAIKTFNQMNKTLYVVGNGPEYKNLKQISTQNISIKRNQSDKTLISLIVNARALIFPGTEDFGMTAIEAFACGTPVIAHKSGGALDFIEENINGMFFDHQTEKSLAETITNFEQKEFDGKKIKESAKKYSKEIFKSSFKQRVETLLSKG